jgi:hypothetical protein
VARLPGRPARAVRPILPGIAGVRSVTQRGPRRLRPKPSNGLPHDIRDCRWIRTSQAFLKNGPVRTLALLPQREQQCRQPQGGGNGVHRHVHCGGSVPPADPREGQWHIAGTGPAGGAKWRAGGSSLVPPLVPYGRVTERRPWPFREQGGAATLAAVMTSRTGWPSLDIGITAAGYERRISQFACALSRFLEHYRALLRTN